MKSLSPDALKAYELIAGQISKNGKAPTIKELATTMNTSTRKALEALRELEDSLVIKRSTYKSRAIEIISGVDSESGNIHETMTQVPILGTAPGGSLLFAEQNIEDHVSIPTRLLKGGRDIFLLRVVGSSMSPFLENGDLALVKKEETANNKDVVVAVIQSISGEYEATIKTFFKDKNQIVLSPINTKEYNPIVGSSNDVIVQGIVVGAFKFSTPSN